MTKNPIINAAVATLYIVCISLLMFYGTKFVPGPDTVLAPITVLSLFSLSAAVMGYLFCYQPIILLLDGKKKEAVELFLKTTACFSVITLIILAVFFSGAFFK